MNLVSSDHTWTAQRLLEFSDELRKALLSEHSPVLAMLGDVEKDQIISCVKMADGDTLSYAAAALRNALLPQCSKQCQPLLPCLSAVKKFTGKCIPPMRSGFLPMATPP